MSHFQKGTVGDKLARKIYYLPLFSVVIGAAVVFVSDLSFPFIIICSGLISVQILHLLYGFSRDKHLDKRWHALTSIVSYNLIALFCWIPFWIITGMKVWLFAVLFIIFSLVVLIGVRIHKKVAIGVYSSKQNRFGKYFYLFAFSWVGVSGGGSYGYSRVLQEIYGYSDTLLIIATLLVPFSYILTFIAQGLWVRVKDPVFDYEADR